MSREYLRQSEIEALEAMIDASSVAVLLGELATLCELKAQHIAESYQDRPLYESWRDVAELVDVAAVAVAEHEKGRA